MERYFNHITFLISYLLFQHVGTDDSMSDDVFEEDTLRAPVQRSTPSPTGYRDYRPESPIRPTIDDDMPIHKVL